MIHRSGPHAERVAFRAAAGLLIVLSLVPVRGLFTASRIFFVRDLGFFFWSRHLWLRHTVFGGELPLWDPYSSAGHAAYADALNQIFMPVTLALRLLPSDIVSFNLWVAMPLPVAIVGMLFFLRRRRGPAASILGACAFALSGAMVSSLNTPNLAWALAFLPWLCWAGDRLAERPNARSAVVLAVMLALQALSGEPVTLAASVVVLMAQSVTSGSEHAPRGRIVAWTVGALAIGAALSAVQMLPTTAAGVRAARAAWSETPGFWSLHPLAAAETVIPHFFGNYYTAFFTQMPWMTALNRGREPLFFSIYVGPLVLLLACAGAAAAPRAAAPWAALAILLAIAAAGDYTPIYPAARHLFHPLAFFRFPVKYLAVACFALAVLAAIGVDAMHQGPHARRRVRQIAVACGVLAVAIAGLLLFALVARGIGLSFAHAIAVRVGITDADAAAAFLLRVGEPLAARSAGLLLAGAALLAVAAGEGRRTRIAATVFLAVCVGDLVITNASLNPTVDASMMRPPSWYLRIASADRLYVGGRLRGFMDPQDPDGTAVWQIPAAPTAIAGRAVLNAELPMEPSGWRVREALSYDLPVLLPSEHRRAVQRFLHSTPVMRAAFLRRSGVRWCVLPDYRVQGTAVADVPDWYMAVTVCHPSASRAFFATSAEITADLTSQLDALFDPRLPDGLLRLAPAQARSAVESAAPDGGNAAASISIVRDATNEVELAAALPREGFVTLLDSYDQGWRATVDGRPTPVLRANGLYRAVYLGAGSHVIRFVYRPRLFFAGLIVSGIAVVLCIALTVGRRRSGEAAGPGLPRRSGEAAESGFTLLELMIVMALIGILLAIAFARYEGMRARANEASADSALRTIAEAQWTFALTCGHEQYATTLPSLAQPAPATGQAFLSPDLTSAEQVEHSGYVFQMTAKPVEGGPPSCSGVPVAHGYAVTADPVNFGISGTRFLAINADRDVYEDERDTFTGNMPEIGAPPHGQRSSRDR
jgi:prepilin-type N-terminal cleavage/methylation domain-containing protein